MPKRSSKALPLGKKVCMYRKKVCVCVCVKYSVLSTVSGIHWVSWNISSVHKWGYCIRKERCKIDNISFYLRKLKTQEQVSFKISIGKEIIKIRAQISEIENRKTTERISERKSVVFEDR